MRHRFLGGMLLVVGFTFCGVLGFSAYSGLVNQTPDPKLLLIGIASVREQIPPSRLYIRVNSEHVFGSSQEDYSVLFDGELRYFAQTNESGGTRILYDGRDVMRFDGQGSVILRNLDSQTSDLLFDPRIFGISALYTWGRTIQGVLYLRDDQNAEMELVGEEEIHGSATWHILITTPTGGKVDLWVDQKPGFRVYRLDERWASGSRTARSFYETTDYPWLPSRVETEEFDSDGKLRFKRAISILAATANVRIHEKVWTLEGLLAGLELSLLVPITDVRAGQIVGYWRDGKLGPPLPWEPAPSPPPLSSKRMISMGLMTVVLLVPVAVLAWRRFSRQRSGGTIE
jgi:hypothetical protein